MIHCCSQYYTNSHSLCSSTDLTFVTNFRLLVCMTSRLVLLTFGLLLKTFHLLVSHDYWSMVSRFGYLSTPLRYIKYGSSQKLLFFFIGKTYSFIFARFKYISASFFLMSENVTCSFVLYTGIYFISYTILFQDNIASSAPTPRIYYRFSHLYSTLSISQC